MSDLAPKTPAAADAGVEGDAASGVDQASAEARAGGIGADGQLAEAVAPSTAGGRLRAARQARGLHIAALAASIKVTQRKLESLEADRYHELPDLTFTRALAKTVCRSLKIDPVPVLALMPQLSDTGLDAVHQGLNTAFRDRPGRLEPTDLSVLTRPAVWLPILLVLAAGGIFLLPSSWLPAGRVSVSAPAAAPEAASAAASQAAAASAVAAAPVLAAASAAELAVPVFPPESLAASAVAPAELTSSLQLRVTGEAWVEVLDASGAVLLQRLLQSGEVVGLDGTPPFKLKVGNASAVQLSFRGQVVDLKAATRDNVARLELK